MGWFGKKPAISPEEKGRVLKAMLEEVNGVRSLAGVIAEAVGNGVAKNDPRVVVIFEDIRVYGVPKDWKSDAAGWWHQATPEARTAALKETIPWATSR